MTNQPTPPAKRDISIEEAVGFLSQHYTQPIKQVEALKGGKHSKAFSYENNDRRLIIRFNKEDRGFLKDKYASELFGDTLPIPKIIEIGTYNDLHFCITEKALGETVRDQYNRSDFTSLPLLFDAVEKIARNTISGTGYGYLDLNGNALYSSHLEYINAAYNSADIFNWDHIFDIPFVDRHFTDYVADKMKNFSQYATKIREPLHGDFGADNVFVKDGSISGIIDWEKMRTGDHFLDIGRVLLFCPDRNVTTSAAIDFYKNSGIEHWKERIVMGVYHVVLTNYAYAALGGNETSCKSSPTRLKELEQGLGL